jgi:pilus assembly protein Flp/PilA
MEKIKRFFKEEEGVTAIEYGVIAALIIVACIIAITAAGDALAALWDRITLALGAA